MEIVVTIILTVVIMKMIRPVKDKAKKIIWHQNYKQLQKMYLDDIQARDNKIKALEIICKKYEKEFGIKESLRILKEIETKQPLGDQDHE